MKLESVTYNFDGSRIKITHERPGVVFVEYDDGRRAMSYAIDDDIYANTDEILGVHAAALTGDMQQAVSIAIRSVARG